MSKILPPLHSSLQSKDPEIPEPQAMRSLQQLVQVSHRVGQVRPLWTQGAGGNISVKIKSHLWVKASGKELTQVSTSSGLAPVPLDIWEEFWRQEDTGKLHSEAEYSSLLQKSQDLDWGRPSMETAFHCAFPDTWVLHFHSLPAVVLADQFWKKTPWPPRLKKEIASLGVSFVDLFLPGLQLARELRKAASSEFYILRNHGVLLRSEDAQVLERWEKFEKFFCDELSISRQMPSEVCPQQLVAFFPDAAMYWERMENERTQLANSSISVHAKPPSTQVEPSRSVDSAARDLLWATRWMELQHPDCRPLPGEFLQQVPQLPTEKIRKELLK